MSNEFEKFIRKNRSDFDDASASDNVWREIEKTLPVKKEAKHFTIRDMYKWTAAAAIFFVTVTSAYFVFIKKEKYPDSYRDENPPVGTEKEKSPSRFETFNSVSMEFAAEFKEAAEAVENRQQELRSAIANDPELYRKFQGDLGILDSAYRLLREQADQSMNRDVIIKAMIQNLKLQAELLGRQLMIINEIQTTKTSKDERNI